MRDKLSIPYPVIVEGKYDRTTLENVIDGNIYTTDGFGVFQSTEKQMLFRALAKKTKIIVLTDSDGGGKVIRSYLSSIIPPVQLISLYVPQVLGKEKRKKEPSKDGFLGVEGMNFDCLYQLFLPFQTETEVKKTGGITTVDLFDWGLTGASAQQKRDAVCSRIGLPSGMNAKAFLKAVNILYTKNELSDKIKDE